MDLDRSEVFGQDFRVSESDLGRGLRRQLVDHQLSVGIIVVVKTRFVLTEDEIWLKADYIMKESSKLVNLASNNDVWARVFVEVQLVLLNILLKGLTLLGQFFYLISQFEHVEELSSLCKLLLGSYPTFKVGEECLHAGKSVLSEVLGRRLVLLNTFQVFDR